MEEAKYLFIGFENLDIESSFSWDDYRKKFNLLDYDITFLNITKWHNNFEYSELKNDINNAISNGSIHILIYKENEESTSSMKIIPIRNLHNNITIDNGKSFTIHNKKFQRYFHFVKKWNWYLNNIPTDEHWHNIELKIIANNNINKPIGFYLDCLKYPSNEVGRLIVLPEIEDLQLGVKILLEDLFSEKIFSKSPIWVKEIKTKNEKIYEIQRNKVKNDISEITKKLEEINNKIESEESIKKILYEDGIELERSIKDFFNRVNIKYHTTKIVEEDCFIESTKGNFLFEIKGSKKGFAKKGLRQLIDWESDLEDKEYIIDRCIFLGNHFRDKPLEERDYPFADNLIKYAEKQDFLLILTQDLFKIYNDYLGKKISTNDIYKIFKKGPTRFIYDEFRPQLNKN